MERIHAQVTALKERRGINIPKLALECGVGSSMLQLFLSGKSSNHSNETLDKLDVWVEANRKAPKKSDGEEVKRELGKRLAQAYQKMTGKMNSEAMAIQAGVNRTVLSQLINGTYTRELRGSTVKSLNAWVDSVLK
jgi:hypothetical protein